MMKRDGIDNDGQSEKVKKTLRGRAEKACVRCRAKKRTCDGGNPCLRCKESHSACYFSDWHYTVPYPREYVEYLEEQQEQLSTGLMTMYRILRESNIQTMPILPDKPQTQDLLAALKGMRLSSQPPPLVRSGSMAGEGLKDGQHVQLEQVLTASPREYHGSVPTLMAHPSKTSPLPPASMFMPRFGPTPSSQSLHMTAHDLHATPVHHNYPAAPYRAFECTQTAHPHMQASQTHPLPLAPTAGYNYLSLRDGALQMPEPWHSSPASHTPSTNTPLQSHIDHPTPLAGTANMFTDQSQGGILHMQQQQQQQQQQHAHQNVPEAWAWRVGSDSWFYASPLGRQHDSRTGREVGSDRATQ